MFTTTTITSKLAQSIVLADRTESCTMHTVCWQQIAPLMLPPFPDCFMWSINFRMNSWFILELPWVNCSGTPDVLSCVDEFSGLVWREILTGNYGLTVLTCFNHEIYWGFRSNFPLNQSNDEFPAWFSCCAGSRIQKSPLPCLKHPSSQPRPLPEMATMCSKPWEFSWFSLPTIGKINQKWNSMAFTLW